MRGKRRQAAIYPPPAARVERITPPPPVPLWRTIALDQLSRAQRALALIDACRWDGYRFVLPHPDSLLGSLEIPAEFERGISLGRLQAALRERIELWQKISHGGRVRCLWCRAALPAELMAEHVGREHCAA